MKKYFVLMTLFVGFLTAYVPSVAQANPLPAVGQRVYVVKKNSFAPVEIKKGEPGVDSSDAVLKDPTMLTAGKPVKHVVVAKPVVKKVKSKQRKGQIAFRPAKINGNMKNPRVEFQTNYLKVGMTEESYGTDFFQKIESPLDDADF